MGSRFSLTKGLETADRARQVLQGFAGLRRSNNLCLRECDWKSCESDVGCGSLEMDLCCRRVEWELAENERRDLLMTLEFFFLAE